MSAFRGLILNGSSGVGKSSALQALSAHLADVGLPHATVDLDFLALSWPSPPDDPYRFGQAVRILTAVAATYRADGATLLAVGHVFTERGQVDACRAAMGTPDAPVIRLRASGAVVERRLRTRHSVDAPLELDGFLTGHDALERTLEEAEVDDAVIDVDDLTPAETAERIAALAELGS